MRRLGFSRTATILLAVTGTLVLLAAFGLATLFVLNTTAVTSNATLATPLRWDSLPAPAVTRPEWTSYAAAQPVNDLLLTDALLWAATDGGVVAWDTRSGESVRFGVEHGLPANRATALAAAPDGRIWVGTVGGVARFDGAEWQRFEGEDDPGAVAVNDLLVQRDGAVWAATDAGLSRFDGTSWRTTTSATLLADLPSDRVTALAAAPGSQLWVGTDAGLVLTNGRSWQTTTTADGLNSNTITALANAPDGTLWAGTDIGLNRFDGRVWDSFLLGEPFAGTAVHTLTPQADGTVMVGFAAAASGIAQFDPTTATTRPLTTADGLSDNAIHALRLDGTGELWAATAVAIDQQTASGWRSFAPPSELPANRVADLLLAPDGLWAATSGGAARFDGRWQTSTRTDGLLDDDVTAIAIGPDGAVWAAHANPLLGFSRSADDGQWERLTCTINTPPSRTVTDAAITPDDTIWLATDNGAIRTDGAAWDHLTTADGLPSNNLAAIQIGPDGAVWAGGPGGLSVWRGAAWQTVSSAPIEALAIAPNGTVWFLTAGTIAQVEGDTLTPAPPLPPTTAVRALAATDDALFAATDAGVARLQDQRWQTMTTDDGLPGTNVTAISRAADNRVWAATNGSFQITDEGVEMANARLELVWFDGTRWQPHPNRDPAAERLANNQVADILHTPDGAIWFATADGVNRLLDDQWMRFTTDDGLPTNATFALAYAFDTVWALTELGLAQFTTENGIGFVPFGGAHGQGESPLETLTVAPGGALWITTADFSDGIRVFDGLAWRVVPTVGAPARLDAATFDAAGRFWVAGQNLSDNTLLFGFYDPAQNGWTWALPGSETFPVSTLAFAPDGTLWLGSAAGQGIELRDVADGDLDRVVGQFAEPTAPDLIHFTADGTALVGSGDQLLRWNGREWQQDEVPIPFMNETWAIATTPKGTVWVASAHGAARTQDGAWDTVYAPLQTPGWWNDISALAVRPDGGIAVGTSSGGIGLYTGRGYLVGRPDAWRGQSYPVNALFNTAAGDLWVATTGAGVAVLNDTGWTEIAPDDALTADVTSLGFTNDGAAWVGTPAGLLTTTFDDDGACRFIPIDAVTPPAVTSALRSRDGTLWFGTENAGALAVGGLTEPTESVWPDSPARIITQAVDGTIWAVNTRQDWLNVRVGDAWERIPLRRDLLTAADITALAVDSTRTAWIGTANGVFVFNGRAWQHLTTADGLPDNQIDDIQITPDGALWFATAGGVGRYRP